MNAIAIAAVVVSHQSAGTIDACLARLRAAADVAEIRVVDNASSDATLVIVQRHALADARVRFVANPDNPGFSAACNQGAADSRAPWLAFVNPDCMVEPDSLARLLAHARALAGNAATTAADAGGVTLDAALVDSALVDSVLVDSVLLGADLVDEEGVRDGAARRNDPDFLAMLRGPLQARQGRPLDVAVDPAQAVQRVDAVSGALMLMPRALFARIGGFDTGYRLHVEDLDLCRRARAAGAIVAVANDVRVVHVRGVSARARPGFVEWHKHRGLWRYFRRFEAPRRGPVVRTAVWAVVWLHWLSRLPAVFMAAARGATP